MFISLYYLLYLLYDMLIYLLNLFCQFKDTTLLKALGQKWPSITYTKDKDFWQAEWSKHGTCSLLEAEKYFQLTLDLYKRVNIKMRLKASGISAEVYAKSFTKEQ